MFLRRSSSFPHLPRTVNFVAATGGRVGERKMFFVLQLTRRPGKRLFNRPSLVQCSPFAGFADDGRSEFQRPRGEQEDIDTGGCQGGGIRRGRWGRNNSERACPLSQKYNPTSENNDLRVLAGSPYTVHSFASHLPRSEDFDAEIRKGSPDAELFGEREIFVKTTDQGRSKSTARSSVSHASLDAERTL